MNNGSDKKIRSTVYLQPKVANRLKHAAVEHEMEMSQIVNEAVQMWLDGYLNKRGLLPRRDEIWLPRTDVKNKPPVKSGARICSVSLTGDRICRKQRISPDLRQTTAAQFNDTTMSTIIRDYYYYAPSMTAAIKKMYGTEELPTLVPQTGATQSPKPNGNKIELTKEELKDLIEAQVRTALENYAGSGG